MYSLQIIISNPHRHIEVIEENFEVGIVIQGVEDKQIATQIIEKLTFLIKQATHLLVPTVVLDSTGSKNVRIRI